MNQRGRGILVAGLVLVVLSLLYPPVLEYDAVGEWSFAGWNWITAGGRRIDLARLAVEWLGIGALATIGLLLFSRGKSPQ